MRLRMASPICRPTGAFSAAVDTDRIHWQICVLLLVWAGWLVGFPVLCRGADQPAAPSPEALEFFETRIRPVLVERCEKCHSSQLASPKGGLALDSREGLLAGGETGPAIVPGDAAASLLVQAVAYQGELYDMPPEGKLPDRVIADFRRWVELGAPDPRPAPEAAAAPKSAGIDLEAGRQFWAFQAPRAAPLPAVQDAAWPRSTVDHWLLARLEQDGLHPAPDADRATLLRRLTFDLLGLPPTPAEIDAFLADDAPDAVERVVDRLLDSPQFGERWGRHWLDVARFAESSGGGRSMVFPQAWRYRDYVIRSFNTDKPFDRFLTEQLAGDLLPATDLEQQQDQLIATAFLMLGATNYEEQDKQQLEMDVIDEQLDVLGKGLLGMTIGCARCHDHKFDPIPTHDYYALAGIFRSTDFLRHSNVSTWTERPLPLPEAQQQVVLAYQAQVTELEQQLQRARAQADAKQEVRIAAVTEFPGIVLDDTQARRVGEWVESSSVPPYIGAGYLRDDNAGKGSKTLTFTPEFPREGLYEVRLAYTASGNRATNVPIEILHRDGEFSTQINQKEKPSIDGRFVSLGTFRFDPSNQWFLLVSNEGTDGHVIVDAVQFLPADAPAVTAEADADANGAAKQRQAAAKRVRELEARIKELKAQAPPQPVAMIVGEATQIADCRICIRGNISTLGEPAPRGFLQVAQLSNPMPLSDKESGRRELAAWITDPRHPLTARVFVNRVWQHLFGAGLVRTVDNFGTTGERPSHPELLDQLALQFQQDGWSVKQLIRSLVLSRAYQMSSTADPAAAAHDPDNRLLWRMNRRRLDAEAIRDALLAASGELDLTPGGPTIRPDKGESLTADGEYNYVFTDTRRSVYTPIFRNRLHELFEVFDFADPNATVGARNVSTVAPQALFLLNSSFVMERARRASEAILARTDLDHDGRIELAFRQTLGRSPKPAEAEIARQAVGGSDDLPAAERQAAWERLYQALFASLDFRYLH